MRQRQRERERANTNKKKQDEVGSPSPFFDVIIYYIKECKGK